MDYILPFAPVQCLHLVQRYPPAVGGSEAVLARISREMAAGGHGVTVVTTTALTVDGLWRRTGEFLPEGRDEMDGVAVIRVAPGYLPLHGLSMQVLSHLPLGDRFRARFHMPGPYLPHLPRVLRDCPRPDIIHVAALPFTPLFAAAVEHARQVQCPVVMTPFMHLDMPPRRGFGYQQPLQQRLLAQADLLLAQTRVEADRLRDIVADAGAGNEQDTVRVMGVGIEPESVAGGNAERFRQRWNLPRAAALVIGYLGALTYDKGAQHLVRAFIAMRQNHTTATDAHLVLAGPQRDDFTRFFDGLSATDTRNIVVTGVLTDDEKRDFLAGLDIFALPSRSESFGIVYLESWTYGTPVIGCDIAAVREVIAHDHDGLLAPFGDVTALAAALETLATSKDLRERLGAAGRTKVERVFRWGEKFERYVTYLHDLGLEV